MSQERYYCKHYCQCNTGHATLKHCEHYCLAIITEVFFFAATEHAPVVFDAQMAAVQALLSAAGLDKPNTKLLKKSTATEHATSSSRSDPATTSNATEHAVSRLPRTWIQMSHIPLLQACYRAAWTIDNFVELDGYFAEWAVEEGATSLFW